MDSDATQRPSSIVVSLEESGVPYSNVNLDASDANVDGNTWTWTGVMNMDKFLNKKSAAYTASTSVAGYSMLHSYASPYSGATITLVSDDYTPSETVDIPVSVVWEDNGDSLNNRPGEVTVNVYAYIDWNQGAEPVRTTTVSAEQGWQGTIEGLPKYDADGNALKYHVVEAVPEFYGAGDSYVECPTTAQATFTNYPIIWTVDVRKQWDDDNDAKGARPASITVGLYKGSTKIDEMTLSGANSTNAAGNTWGKSFFTKYPMAENGAAIAYSVKEADVANYTAEPMEVSLVGFKGYHKAFGIRNTYNPTIDIPVTATWVDANDKYGNRPDSVTYNLYSVPRSSLSDPGSDFTTYTSTAEPTLVTTKVATRKDGYATTISAGLPTCDENGNELAYLVGEDEVPGYNKVLSYSHINGNFWEVSKANVYDGTNPVNVSNTLLIGYAPSVYKVWEDKGHEGERPAVTFRIYEQGGNNALSELTLTSEDALSLSPYADNYETVDRYLHPSLPEDITKVWFGSFRTRLWVSQDNDKAFLPQYKNGKPVSYEVREVARDGYKSSGGTVWEADNPAKRFYRSTIVTNTYKKKVPIASATVAPIASQTYTGSAIKPTPKVTLGGKALALGTDFTLSYANNTNAGTATITVTGKGAYEGSTSATFQIDRAANPLRAKAAKASLSVTYKPKAATVTAGNVTVGGAQGGVTYANASTDVTAKKFAVVKATGKVTVPKATGAGTYTVKIKATAAGNSNYEPGSKTVSYKLTVAKAAQPMRLKAVKRTAKVSKLKKGAVTVAAPLKFAKKAQGKVTYAKAKGSAKCLTVNKKTGKVTIKRGTKRGTYKVKIKVTAKGTRNYKAGSKTITCKVVVK